MAADAPDRAWRRSTFGPNKYQRAAGQGSANAQQMAMRRALNYYGQGDYADAGRMIGTGLGGLIGGIGGTSIVPGAGTAAGAAAGAGIGMEIGEGLGHMADTYFGKGDYGKSVNQIVAGGRSPISVNQGSDRTGDIFISQTEYLGNVTATNAFHIEEYELNPGIHKTFPFLSQLANNYELYEWDGLMVCYKPLSGEGGSNNVLGKVIIATNYDPTAEKFKNSLEMQNYDYCSTGKPSQTVVHGIETAQSSKLTRMLYVRNTAVKRDKAFTDIGKLFVATEGMPSGSSGAIGELHITYRIRLSRAKLYASLGNFGITGALQFAWNGSTTVGILDEDGEHGEPPFSILRTDGTSATCLTLKDKNFVSGTFKVTVTAYSSNGASGGNPIMVVPANASLPVGESGDGVILHKVTTLATTSYSPWFSMSDSYWKNNGTAGDNGSIMVSGSNNHATDNVSITTFILSVNNPNDEQPSFRLYKGSSSDVKDIADFSSSATIAMEYVHVHFEQIDALGDDATYTW